MAHLYCECQELKPKVETKSSFLVLHPSSGVDTVNTIGSHLNAFSEFFKLEAGPIECQSLQQKYILRNGEKEKVPKKLKNKMQSLKMYR